MIFPLSKRMHPFSEQGVPVRATQQPGEGVETLAYRTALPPLCHRLEGFGKEGGNRQKAPDDTAAAAKVSVRRRDLLFPADVIFGRRPADHVDVLLVVQLHVLQVHLPEKPR